MTAERRIRDFLTTLPNVEETIRPRSGKALYWVPAKALGGKTFAVVDAGGERGAGRPVLSFRARPERYGTLIAERGFAPAPYAARFAWVATTSWPPSSTTALEALLRDAYTYTLERQAMKVLALPQDR